MPLRIAHGLLRTGYVSLCYWAIAVLLSTNGQKNHTKCAYFIFYNVSDDVVSATENTEVEITFSLTENCIERPIYFLSISRFIIQESRFEPVCRIAIRGRICADVQESPLCSCLTQTGLYRFTKTLVPSDSTQWRWSSTGNAIDVIKTFNVTNLTKVLSLTVDVTEDIDLISSQKKILIRCSWEKGNLVTNVHLLNNNTVLLTSDGNFEELMHTISSVQCFETGIITCKPDDPRNGLSAAYHVSCPPLFQNTTLQCYNSSFDVFLITLFIYADTTEITDCTLTRHLMQEHAVNSALDYRMHKCHINSSHSIFANRTCQCIINGTLPYLSLTAYIFNVTETDDGNWNINISNNAGSSQHTFCVRVQEKAGTDITNNDPLNSLWKFWVLGAAASIIIIIICVACKCIAKNEESGLMETR